MPKCKQYILGINQNTNNIQVPMSIRYTFFCQITTFIKVCAFFVFELQTLESIDFSKIYELKGLEHENKSHTKICHHCDLTKMCGINTTPQKWNLQQ